MKKARDPRRTKRLSLERDHRVFPLAGDKTFRKKWPLTKAKANRRVRRAEHVALQEAAEMPDSVEVSVQEARSHRKRKLQKLGVVSLQQHLEVQADQSLRWTAATHGTNKQTIPLKLRRLRAGRSSK